MKIDIIQFTSHSEKQTLSAGRKIAKSLKEGDVVCLYGDLGSGKTVLTKGIASGLGISFMDIISPTFVLLRRYQGKKRLNHFDFYRVKNAEEIINLGYEEYFYDRDITVIEWPDRLGTMLPREFLKIELRVKSDNERIIKMSAVGDNHAQLLNSIYENLSR